MATRTINNLTTIEPVETTIPDTVLEQAALDLQAKELVTDESSFYHGMPVTIAQELTDIGGDVKRMHLESLYQIGEKLAQAKAKLHEYKKSGWNQWVEEYTTVSRVYADQAIDVYEMGKNATNLLHTGLSNTTLIKMAKPSTPETARLQIAALAESGEKVDGKTVDTIIKTAKEAESVNAKKADIQKEIRDLELKREGATTLRKKVIDKSIAQKQTELESITQVKPVAEVDSAAVAVTA